MSEHKMEIIGFDFEKAEFTIVGPPVPAGIQDVLGYFAGGLEVTGIWIEPGAPAPTRLHVTYDGRINATFEMISMIAKGE